MRPWWRGHQDQVEDGLIVAALLVMGLVEAAVAPMALGSRWQQALLAVVYAGVLMLRRRWPVAVLALVIALGPVMIEVNVQGGVISYVLAALVASYSVGRHLDRPATWWGPVITIGFEWVVFAVVGAELSDYVFVGVLYGGAWAVGYALRQREKRIAVLSDEAEDLRRSQAEEAARAVATERQRIARELHDIVSHSISVITIQTQAVRRRLDPANQREINDLRAVETTARQAMAEMRRLLGVLRADETDDLDLAPQPGLAQLPRLVNDTVAAGVPVTLVVDGEVTPLPPGVDLAAYRVAQEALTNVRRHAAGSTAVVSVRYTADTVEVQVDNDESTQLPSATTAGHGLHGMSERINLYRGRLDVGPRPGGYRVRAVLPIRERTG